MTFRYQPDAFAPDPWPVDGPAQMSDNEYADALASVPTPDIYDVDSAVVGLPAGNLIVWMLLLGESYDAEGGTIRGYYIRAVVRDKLRLRDNFTAIMRGSASNEAGQLALSLRLIPRAENETRAKVIGWGFASQ